MSISDIDSRILIAASNIVALRPPGQGVKRPDLVKATIQIYHELKEELEKNN
ncbi:hypothetical protein KAJ27_00575 [bacterium]|nr:hypothetical protein [bacterium]